MEICLVLHNIRSTYNVGAILRTAEGFGVPKVVLSGYTPWYGRPGLLPHLAEKLERQITKTAVGADKMVRAEWVEDLLGWLNQQEGAKIGLENNTEDSRLQKLGDFVLEQKVRKLKFLAGGGSPQDFDERAILVLGEEVEGIPREVLDKLDVLLEIPMHGQKESFNVSVAAGIALYELIQLKTFATLFKRSHKLYT